MYNSMMAMEISRIVHAERLAASKHNLLLHDLALAHRLEHKTSPLQRMQKMMTRVMHLFF